MPARTSPFLAPWVHGQGGDEQDVGAVPGGGVRVLRASIGVQSGREGARAGWVSGGVPEEELGGGFTAEGEDGRVIGEYKRAGFSTRGTIVWDGVEYEWGKTSAWTSAYRLSRLSEELATFDPKSLGNRIAIDLSAGNLPKELVLFCAWMAHVALQDASG